ncbi:50S ribosomal protein L18 [Candidatus Pacearchaeota archaeon]|nr:50S ribosomal protein L18 [Candidatus Pacearchaeota archaeon]
MGRTLKRRRLEARTDYRARLAMLKADKPRLVVRKTNRYIIAQVITSTRAQDTIVTSVTSKELLEKGWPPELSGSLKSRAAAYLTGFLLGIKVKGKIKEALLDVGMHRNVAKSRIYALLKGALDAGMHIPHSEEILPTDEEVSKNGKGGTLAIQLKQKLSHG